jgi:hypothetical protein
MPVNLLSKSPFHLIGEHLAVGSNGEKNGKYPIKANYFDGGTFFFEKFDRILCQELSLLFVF